MTEATPSATLHLVAPAPFSTTSGGYRYDREMLVGLERRGIDARALPVSGPFPGPDPGGCRALDTALGLLPDGDIVVLDGLAGGTAPTVLAAHRQRLRLIGLVHHPLHLEVGASSEARARSAPAAQARSAQARAARQAELATLEGAALGQVRGVIVPSRATARAVMAMGVEPERIRIVQPGVAPVEPRAAGADGPGFGAGPVRLLAVGALIRRKGYQHLLEALAGLPPQLEWTLDLVGSLHADPGHADALLHRARAPGLAGRVHLHGEVSDDELASLWAGAQLFVHPSLHEGWGIVLAEAMVRGLPVVTTTAGAIPDLVPAPAGARVAPGDPDALGRALERFLADPEARHAAGRAAAHHARSLPDWDQQAGAFGEAVAALARPAPGGLRRGGAVPEVEGGPAAPEHFDPLWLDLREAADHRSRASGLEADLLRQAREEGWTHGVDLGGGTGSNVRHLSQAFHAAGLPALRWTVVDHDPRLLARLPEATTAICGTLGVEGIEAAGAADLVTASALLDLVTEDWVEALVRRVDGRARALLLALSWDGSAVWRSPDGAPLQEPRHEALLAAVHRHQSRDKGMGPALGPGAPEVAVRTLRAAGWEVTQGASPWQLGSGDLALASALVEGWLAAAREVDPDAVTGARPVEEGHLHELARGDLLLEVGHVDLLGRPPRRPDLHRTASS